MKIETDIHKLLKRQIQKSQDEKGNIALDHLFGLVSEIYTNSEEEQFLSHQSLTLMSQELSEVNNDLERRAAALKESEERYALASLGANDGLWDWDIALGKCFYSDRWKEIIGFAPEDEFKTIDDWLNRIHPDYQEPVREALKLHVEGKSERFESEYQIKNKNERYQWVLTRGVAARDKEGKAIRVAGSQSDMTQRKKYEEQLFKAAFHDKLTGLPNRALFMDRLKQTMKGFKRGTRQKLSALMFLDLDRFKIVNDSFGHEAGDQLLVTVARRLEINLRPEDTICRLGGDEFTILLNEVESVDQAKEIANRLIEEINKPYFIYSQQAFVSVSIGIVVMDGYESPENVMRNADLAMYQAKNAGKSRAEVFDKSHYDKIYNTLQIETDLRLALNRGELHCYFQPIIDLKTGTVACLEALMRWNHPKKGLISPLDFISIAEENSMIIPMGERLMSDVLAEIKSLERSLEKKPVPPVAINISVKQLLDDAHFERLIALFKESKLPPGSLKLEMTESMLMENLDRMKPRFERLKESGFELSIDDFGTGYSSLHYLTMLPFDYIKIDKTFVFNLGENEKKRSIVKAMIGLANDFGMKVVAEGVETLEVLQHLQKMGCHYAQGYFFSKPKPPKDILAFLKNEKANLEMFYPQHPSKQRDFGVKGLGEKRRFPAKA